MIAPEPRGPRLRELGLTIGRYDVGLHDAITDVSGVTVGHVTIWRNEPEPPVGRGIARTGVTTVVPASPDTLFAEPVPAGVAVLNGAGELTGSIAISEWGLLETPVYLTSTHAVGRVYDGAVAAAVEADASVGTDQVVIPVVGECDDSWLSDARVVQVEVGDARRALTAATSGPVAEGAVGAGTGMLTKGFKAGIGTSSRLVPSIDAALGVLVLANFGGPPGLIVDGVDVGNGSGRENVRQAAGSCIVVVAVDAALSSHQLERVARRAGLGLARTGSIAHHGSGEIFLAFAPPGRQPRRQSAVPPVPDVSLDDVFEATVDATEEAVLNALWAAPEVSGRGGNTAPALPHDDVVALLEKHGRLG